MTPIKAPTAFLLLTASLLLGLAVAHPHRAYHDDADVQAPEKNVRHIDGLGAQQRAEEAMRQLQDQVKSQGGGSGSGSWSVRYSEYSSGSRGGEAGSSGAPVRATITGEAVEGADGVLGVSTNCHNCRMRIRKVGAGEYAGEYAGEQAARAGGVQQVQSSQSSQRHYTSRSEGGQDAGRAHAGSAYGGSRSQLGSGSSSSRVVQSSRVVESSDSGYGATRPEYADVGGVSGSSRKDTRVTKSSWQLSDLGYGTTNIEDLIRRLDEDMRAGRFQNGKTVTTVTTTTSENGGPPVTRQETFVKDGVVDVAALPGASAVGAGRPVAIGHSEVEDLLKGLREDLREGKTQAGKTVTTVVESSSVNGAPVVKKNTYARDAFDMSALETIGADATRLGLGAGQLDLHSTGGGGSRSVSRTTHSSWSSGGRAPQHVDHLGGGDLLTKTHTTSRNTSSVSTYSSDGSSNHDVRAVDSLGGGHLIRDAGSVGGYGAGASGAGYSSGSSSSTSHQTRRVDALGGGHLIRDTEDYGAGTHGAGSQSQYGSGSQSQYGSGSQSQYGSGSQSQYGSSSQTQYGSGSQSQYGSGSQSQYGSGSQSQYGASSSRYGASSSHYGGGASGSELKSTRRVDGLGGGHLLRETDSYGQATQETMSVSQMPGYRKEDSPVVDDTAPAYGSTSKYYSTFQSGGGYTGGVVDDAATGQQVGVVDAGATDGASRTSSSSSTYKKVVTYSSTGTSGSSGVTEERDVDRLGGGHLIRGVPGDAQRAQTDAGGNSAFITAEQSAGRIPEAAPGSYFSSSSSYQRTSGGSGLSGVNPAAPAGPVVPVRGSSSSSSVSGSAYGSRTEWSDVQESRADPPLGPATTATPSIKLGYGNGNGGPPAASANPAPGGRGGKLSVSLMDIGILPPGSSSSDAAQQVSQSSGYGAGSSGYNGGSEYSGSSTRYSSSSYGASGSGYGASSSGHGSGTRTYSSRTYEASAPVSSHSSWSSHSTYSSGSPSVSYGGAVEGIKGQRMTQVHRGPDCDNAALNM